MFNYLKQKHKRKTEKLNLQNYAKDIVKINVAAQFGFL